jgi:hypothetical protein
MVSKGRHPNKVIADTLKAIDTTRFTVEEIHRGHRWGVLTCRRCGQGYAIWSTPRVPEHEAESYRRFMKQHQHGRD